ncbi:MAG: Mur ligase domain-containing protein [Leptospiraceae bacterium]|nr:Mur ligase domain-containing protein [Leptospiraceae bacterium]
MKIFLIGIGGIAMGNLARMLQVSGHEISGSDENLYPPMSDALNEWGMKTYQGFNKENLKGSDLVIVGNAISRGNPEVEEMLNSGMEYMSMPQAISHFFLKGKKVIVVSGTHGKTTTTFLIHHILTEIGLNPGLFVGGIRRDGHPGFLVGTGEHFVIEGDEYDSAFFDKSSKFLHYRPYYLGMTSLDFDHADIFPNLEAIEIMFHRLTRLVPSNGKIFYYSKSKSLQKITKKIQHSPTESYSVNSKDSVMELVKGIPHSKKNHKRIETSLIGEHNFHNLELALRIALTIAPDKSEEIFQAVKTFSGVKRRQDILFQSDQSILMEDFAHHPVAILETIKAVKTAYPKHSILSLFEPRSATSHRNIFQQEFASSFTNSKASFVTEVYNLKKVNKEERLDVKKLVKDISKKSKVKNSFYAKDSDGLLKKLDQYIKTIPDEKILILAMSNGSFGGIYPKLKKILEERETI